MSEATTQLAALAAEFKPGEHKTRTQGGKDLTYISIDATINRLNDVLGPGWSTEATTDVTPQGNGFLAVTQVNLQAVVDGMPKRAYGVGADRAPDPDKAAKTALAEAIKKAAHQLGVGIYLWDEEARERTQRRMKLDGASESELKKAVYNLAKERLGIDRPTQAQVAKAFGKKAGDLTDAAVNRAILEDEGVL